jgi:flagellar biosynthesis protein FlhF
MNVKRFVARTSRDALVQVRQAFGEDAVILSTRPCKEGVEVLAMEPDSVAAIEKFDAKNAPAPAPVAARPAPAMPRAAAKPAAPVDKDVERLAMSTLSFQDYVRERMLKRRQAAMQAPAAAAPAMPALPPARAAAAAPQPIEQRLAERVAVRKAEHAGSDRTGSARGSTSRRRDGRHAGAVAAGRARLAGPGGRRPRAVAGTRRQ